MFKRGLLQTCVLYLAVPTGFWLNGLTGALVGIVLTQMSVAPLMLHAQRARGLLDWRFEASTLVFVPVGALAGLVLNLLLSKL